MVAFPELCSVMLPGSQASLCEASSEISVLAVAVPMEQVFQGKMIHVFSGEKMLQDQALIIL